MNNDNTQLDSLLKVVNIKSPNTFYWFNQKIDCSLANTTHAPGKEDEWFELTSQLINLLYQNFYVIGMPVRFLRQNNRMEPALSENLTDTLSFLNSGIGYWQPGWTISKVKDEWIYVNHDGLTLRVHRKQCRSTESEVLYTGMQVQLQFPKEFRGMSPGHFVAAGDKGLERNDATQLIRIYCHLAPNCEAEFIQWATNEFNKRGLAFWIKILTTPDRYHRCDNAMIFINKQDFPAVATIISRNHQRIKHYFNSAVPVFTKLLCNGIGMAEDPGNGESFGTHRCSILAQGIIQAHRQGAQSLTDKRYVIEQQFLQEGIHPQQPFLNASAIDHYHLMMRTADTCNENTMQASRQTKNTDDTCWLECASSIAEILCSSAIWSDAKCTWLGYQIAPNGSIGVKGRLGLSTLNQDLYGGISGIALFIAELARVTQDGKLQDLVIGAIHQILAQFENPLLTPLGLHNGRLGIALVLARIAHLLDKPSLLSESVRIIQYQDEQSAMEPGFDVLDGLAGSVLGLIILQKLTGQVRFLEFAQNLADQIITGAQYHQHGCSWPDPRNQHNINLLGYSHGTAGIAHCLLELYAVTGNTKYKETALSAIDYENYWFDSQQRNWPDLRNCNSHTGLPNHNSYMCTWCHGAAGVALSRMRGWQLLGDTSLRDEAVTALGTTHATVENWCRNGIADFSLCHGVAGNLDILLEGERMFGKEIYQDRSMLHQTAHLGIKQYRANGQWPTGLVTGSTPGLMMGLAGIGHFYLRMHDPKVPSILALSADNFFTSSPLLMKQKCKQAQHEFSV